MHEQPISCTTVFLYIANASNIIRESGIASYDVPQQHDQIVG